MSMTNNRRRVILTLVSAATIFGASACGSAGTGTNTSAAPPAAMAPSSASMGPDMSGAPTASVTATTGTAADAVIQIKSFAYTGPDSVSAGSKVTVTNLDSQAHTLTADDGSFNAVVEPGASVTFTAPTKPGSYTYHCNYHGSMHGTLTVK